MSALPFPVVCTMGNMFFPQCSGMMLLVANRCQSAAVSTFMQTSFSTRCCHM